jgi:hypothetical protein
MNVLRFTIWSHRSAESIFAASSSPVNRNGEILSFDNEDRAREMRSAQCQARVLYRALHRRKRAKCFGRWWGRADTCKADCFLSFSLGGLFGSPAINAFIGAPKEAHDRSLDFKPASSRRHLPELVRPDASPCKILTEVPGRQLAPERLLNNNLLKALRCASVGPEEI